MGLEFFDEARSLIDLLERQEEESINEAAKIVAHSLSNDGIIQAFGGGHSYASALEITGRAGGFIPSKAIKDPAEGMYQKYEGVGTELAHRVRIDEHDVVFIISNSGRNPMVIELAEWAKEKGNPIIVVTSLESSKQSTSRHSNGKLLYEYADVILDNHTESGDAALNLEGLDTKLCGTSSLSAVLLLQQVVYQAAKIMVENGIEPPIYKSANVDGGSEYNKKQEKKYADRIFHW